MEGQQAEAQEDIWKEEEPYCIALILAGMRVPLTEGKY